MHCRKRQWFGNAEVCQEDQGRKLSHNKMLSALNYVALVPVGLFHSGDSDVEGRAACIQDVAPSCQKYAGGVDSKWVALHHVTLQAVEGAVLGDLQMSLQLCQHKLAAMSNLCTIVCGTQAHAAPATRDTQGMFTTHSRYTEPLLRVVINASRMICATYRLKQADDARSGDCPCQVIRGLPGEDPDLAAVERPGWVGEGQVGVEPDAV